MDRAVIGNKEEILDANTAQLSKGLTSKNDPIAPDYVSNDYSQFKMALGSKAPFGTPNLYVTGEFYGGFYFKVDSNSYEIGSKDSKEGILQQWYGKEIFGLTDESKRDLNPQIVETLLNDIRNELLR